MKILIVSQYYKPVKAAASKRMGKVAHWLNGKGFDVTVLTGMASYPTGIVPAQYQGKLSFKEEIDGIKIHRTYEYPAANSGFIKRILNYLSFTFSASWAILTGPYYDIVIVTSPPIFTGIAGLTARWFRKSKFIFDVRDLWPDSALEAGMIKPGLVANVMEKMEKSFYKNAQKITTATANIKEHLKKEGWPTNKVQVLMNTVDTDKFKPKKIGRKKYGFTPDDFILAYTGNHGIAQDLDTFIKIANELKDNPRIKFLFVGEGEVKQKLQAITDELKLKSVTFWPEQEPEKIIEIINLADMGIISLNKGKIFQQAIPTKSSEYFSCGKPVIATVSGELKKYIDKYNVGFAITGKDIKKGARVILRLAKNKKMHLQMSKNARQLALQTFSDKVFFRNIARLINELS